MISDHLFGINVDKPQYISLSLFNRLAWQSFHFLSADGEKRRLGGSHANAYGETEE